MVGCEGNDDKMGEEWVVWSANHGNEITYGSTQELCAGQE